MTAVGKLADFRALDPFFRIIEEGVPGLVDGEHFFVLLMLAGCPDPPGHSPRSHARWLALDPAGRWHTSAT
jgi:hypothetical protein